MSEDALVRRSIEVAMSLARQFEITDDILLFSVLSRIYYVGGHELLGVRVDRRLHGSDVEVCLSIKGHYIIIGRHRGDVEETVITDLFREEIDMIREMSKLVLTKCVPVHNCLCIGKTCFNIYNSLAINIGEEDIIVKISVDGYLDILGYIVFSAHLFLMTKYGRYLF